MTASDLYHVIATVATIQVLCDLVAHWTVFGNERYVRAVEAWDRAKWKKDKEKKELEQIQKTEPTSSNTSSTKKAGKTERQAKKVQRADDDLSAAGANIAKRHTLPNVLTSILFFIVLRVLGTEYTGKIVGILPFTPFSFMRRITARNLQFGLDEFEPVSDLVTEVGQACSFTFIYLLCGLSVKFYISKLIGKKAPKGAEGVMAVLNSPFGRGMLRAAGIDPEELKQD